MDVHEIDLPVSAEDQLSATHVYLKMKLSQIHSVNQLDEIILLRDQSIYSLSLLQIFVSYI